MTDRNVEFPQRYRLVQVEGTDDIYDIVPAPGVVSTEGTIVSKATMLSDQTAAKLGLTQDDPTVDDALNTVGGILGDVWRQGIHLWKRWPYRWDETYPNTYSNLFVYTNTYAGSSNYTLTYADSIDIDQMTGNISFVNPQTIDLVAAEGTEGITTVAGKYFYSGNPKSGSGTTDLPQNERYFLAAEDSVISYQYIVINSTAGKSLKVTNAKAVVPELDEDTSQMKILLSADPDVYPKNTVVDGYRYDYFGDYVNWVPWAMVQSGTYTGTGGGGANEYTGIKTKFEPKLVMVTGPGSSASAPDSRGMMILIRPSTAAITRSLTIAQVKWESDGVSWYAENGNEFQANAQNLLYTWHAWG